MTTLATIYGIARATLDSDSDELTDSLMGAWTNMAELRIYAALERSLKVFGAQDTLTPDGTADFAPATVTHPMYVNGPNFQLEQIPHQEALLRWPLNRVAATPSTPGTATHWSWDQVGQKVWLWPAPATGSGTLLLTGTKTPVATATTVTSTALTLPDRYVNLIVEYLVAKGAEMQQNLSLANQKLSRFEAELDLLVREDTRAQTASVVTINGGRSRGPEWPLGRLRYAWE
jgi:hypothetical protein